MKKPKKPKKPNLAKISRPFKKAKPTEERVNEALSNVPRITNETVGEHREEVLSTARKYIYPLEHSKHRVVRISLGLFVAVIIAFLAFCGLALYKFQTTSGFMHDITRIIPFPVAKAGHDFVSYESYLFELRRNMHYYRTQQLTDFSTKDGKEQLVRLKQQAMTQVIEDSYVKQLAEQNNITVTDKMVDEQVALVRSQNRLGANDRVFKDVLKQFWGWSVDDFRRELRQELLQQAVVGKLDQTTNEKAQSALKRLQKGGDFGKLAKAVSEDDNTKGDGGQYPSAISPTDRDLSPAVINTLFKLKAKQISGIVNTGYTLEIVKVLEVSKGSVQAAHIQFNLKPVTTYVAPLQVKDPPKYYIKV